MKRGPKCLPKVPATCLECGQTYYTWPYRRAQSKYCGMACLGVANGRRVQRYDIRALVSAITGNDCVAWPGSRNKRSGYGKARLDGHEMHAHTAAFVITAGRPLRVGEIVCHTCDNPPCFNPAHLYGGTNKMNSEDMVRRGRSCRGIKNHAAKLTVKQVLSIRADWRPRQVVADAYGVSLSAIKAIRRRKTWAHL